jgi:hypothetical protein
VSGSIESCPSCGEPLVLTPAGNCTNCGRNVTAPETQVAGSSDAAIPQAGARRRSPIPARVAAFGVAAVVVVAIGAIVAGLLLGGAPTSASPASSQIAGLETPTVAPTGGPTSTVAPPESANPSASPGASSTLATTLPSSAAPTATPALGESTEPGPGCGDSSGGTLVARGGTTLPAVAAPYAAPAATIASGHFVPAGALVNGGGYDAAVMLTNGKVLFVGGGNPLNRAEIYDPATNTFTATGSMVEGRRRPLAVALPNGKAVVASGISGGCAITNIDSVEVYDPATGHFTSLGAPMLGSDYQTATLLSNGQVLFAGGLITTEANPDGVPSAELFDPATNAFAATGAPGLYRNGATATLLPDHTVLFAGGGWNETFTNTAELYRPDHGDFVPVTATMKVARSAASATLLADGRVLIAGGINATPGTMASAELYDPATGTFTATGSLRTPRATLTTTLLPGNKVLVTGGLATGSTTAEVWAGGTFTATAGPMTHDRPVTTATLLPNGRVLVVGNGTADLYQP